MTSEEHGTSIQITNLEKVYVGGDGAVHALSGLNMAVDAGEVVALDDRGTVGAMAGARGHSRDGVSTVASDIRADVCPVGDTVAFAPAVGA